jgi:small subunit ribosomal protein S7
VKIFLTALDNCKPLLKLEKVNKGGITYQCPMPMSEKQREFKAIKFIISSCLEKDRPMRFYDALANELLDAYEYQVNINIISKLFQFIFLLLLFNSIKGKSIKKKIDIHKLAEANRAYAHYRWMKN